LFLLRNPLLTNLDGLDGLSSITSAGSWLSIYANPLLANIDGLASVTSVAGSLFFGANASLTNVDGLSGIASFAGDFEIVDNPMLADLNGLSGLDSVHLEGRLIIVRNDSLTTLTGLSGIISVGNYFLDEGSGGGLVIAGNVSLNSLDGLSNITSVDGDLRIVGTALQNLDGLSNLIGVGENVLVSENSQLSECAGLTKLLDDVDDGEPGPGPGLDGIPDIGGEVNIGDNLSGCNSVQEILATVNPSKINPGLNDAWYDPETSGQGFFITVFPDLGYVSLAWFTYDTELPAEDAEANLGDAGHRWLTALGPIEGNQVLMNIDIASGGIFDTATDIQHTDPPGSDGTIVLTFDSCNSATVEYDIPSIDQQGIIPLVRVANDNIVICEALSTD
jgi:hypothetical protein